MSWDPAQYARYGDERARPFHDLVARVGATTPRRVVDLGCGTGVLTAELAARWPDASVLGLDSSPEMIAAAAATPGLTFTTADLATWEMPADADVVVSNAALQWVPDHLPLLRRWAAALPAGGWLAIQVPDNFEAPSHVLMRALAESPTWRGQLGGVLRHGDAVARPEAYADVLLAAGLRVDVWQTTYLHVLAGDDPVLQWVRGTGLRPVLAALSADDAERFSEEYAARLRDAYPATAHGTIFPFRRTFAVAHRARPVRGEDAT